MFGIKYDTWEKVCSMYFSLSSGSLKSYLQWFPFTKLKGKDIKYMASESFYNKYIKTSSFLLFPYVMHQSENFLQKGDGSFRDSSLVSPILYLVLQCVGKAIHDKYNCVRPKAISVYYAGNYENMRPSYKQDYDDFFKEINSCIEGYQYFIKTDITNFFSNINVDKLVAWIDKICNDKKVEFTQMQLHLYKELLKYCGNGRFPLIENSVASSFLATVVYLDDVDNKLYKYISRNISAFSYFRIIRYVDDMYILIKSDKSLDVLHEAYNDIRNEYSSILKEYGLALNSKKSCIKVTKEISEELKKSLYDEYFNGEKHNIEELFRGALKEFLSDLSMELSFDSIDIEKYNELIYNHFSSDDVEFTASEVFNYFVYENKEELQSATIISEIDKLVNRSISFINLDPKRLTIMIMKTHSEKAIKSFLRQLFERDREDKWNSYDTTIAISYLIQREFRHIDLLDVLYRRHTRLYEYYHKNCKMNFVDCFNVKRINTFCEIISGDKKAHYLYFMYLCEMKRENYMAAFAYFKNYFDRITADMAFVFKPQQRLKQPNYNAFYDDKSLISFYKGISNSREIIKKAHDLRNSNPLSHASSELLDNENTSEDLKQVIKELTYLIYEFVEKQATSV